MKTILFTALLLLMISCSATKVNSEIMNAPAQLIIYRTKADYFHNVPVLLNDARDKIVSFPAPSDLYYQGELALPVKLEQGYLLDRRGISIHSAFTSYTYESYSKLESIPSLEELYDRIIDKEPFESMYDCGVLGQSGDPEKELNREIRKGMKNFKSLLDR